VSGTQQFIVLLYAVTVVLLLGGVWLGGRKP
jgi:hypothetical protein